MKQLLRAVHNVGKISLIVLFIALTFIYTMLQGKFVSWFLFYSFIPFGLYSLLLPFCALWNAEVRRITNQKEYTAGQQFLGTITIKRKIPFPLLYLIVEEVLPMEFKNRKQSKSAKVLLFPGFKRNISYQYVINAIPRGEHTFSNVRVKTGDVFGIIEKETIFSVPNKFLVYPQYVDIAYRKVESYFEQGTLSSNVNIARDTTVSAGVRGYKPGDRFSWIDWKTTARKNNIMTKEFEQQRSHDAVIFMDRTPSPMFELVVTFTASLIRSILKQDSQASFISTGKEQTIFSLHHGETQLQQIFCHLAKVQADNMFSLSQTIEMELKKIYQPITFVLVTSNLSPDIQKTAESMSMKNSRLMIFVVKEKAHQFSNRELNVLETLRKQKIFVKAVYGNHYANVFFGVSK
ncbi:DUF58 domain-containing protein [Bacillus sp. NPDC094106]|uniref:DUF58 domain-containing protein n=1 Tax=Bacillus sp. NPDC094106 TaxID=3363949 RepID=UPI00382A1631